MSGPRTRQLHLQVLFALVSVYQDIFGRSYEVRRLEAPRWSEP